ncbi:MAG: ECF transporter S component, partial [Lachnospiraceae bacterium]|nr:ECF transporter S component [Lachnospiraceae bacterium]
AVKAVWISVGCRIMIGVVAGWVWIVLKKLKMNHLAALAVTGFTGSMVNTVFVMGSIYLMLAREYAQVKSVAVDAVWGLVMGTVTASGIPEAIAAAILVTLIGKVLLKVLAK